MSNREILKKARAEVVAGGDRQKIFAAYQSQVKRPLHLATAIASVPHPEREKTWAIVNWILVALLILAALGKIFTIFALFADRNLLAAVGLALLGVLVPVAFAIEIARFNGQIYTILGIMCLAAYLQILNHFHGDYLGAAIDVAFISVILFLSILLKIKVFPNLGLGGAKKDPAGNFIL